MKKESEDALWEQWVNLYPFMEIGRMKFVSFDEYKKTALKPATKSTELTEEDIMAEILPIVAVHKKK